MSEEPGPVVLVTLPMSVDMARELFAELGRELNRFDKEAAGNAERAE
jgi:hypothetical protein